eukprot:COSAG06_NODE_19126_length_852_cov_1.406375_1_plen_36_part_10
MWVLSIMIKTSSPSLDAGLSWQARRAGLELLHPGHI